MGQLGLPVSRHQLRYLVKCVNVSGKCQGHDIRREAIDDGTRLFAGTPVGLLDGDDIAGLFFPMGGERPSRGPDCGER